MGCRNRNKMLSVYLVCTDVNVFAEPFAGLSDFVLQIPVGFVACLLPEVQVGGHLLHLCQRVAVDLSLLLYFGAAAAFSFDVGVILMEVGRRRADGGGAGATVTPSSSVSESEAAAAAAGGVLVLLSTMFVSAEPFSSTFSSAVGCCCCGAGCSSHVSGSWTLF